WELLHNDEVPTAVAIDEALLGAYLAAARQAGEKYALLDDITLSAAMRLPDVFDVKKAEEDRDAVTALALAALEGAASQLRLARAQEGARLAKDLLGRLDTLEGIAAVVALRAPKVVEDYRARLDERISAVLAGVEVDRQRLATEVALFADKASIDEELVRLKSHIAQMRGLLRGDEAVGRRLDFVVQELNREFNTIGSKANDAEISEKVIFGKAEIEKIREQVQNIE
ncbi:MAG TPA: YicC family protein, partial [Clostridia bacterium]|nr:YicC family protein [Clostridia bacterium]